MADLVMSDDIARNPHQTCGASPENQRLATQILIDARRRRLKREAEEKKAQREAEQANQGTEGNMAD